MMKVFHAALLCFIKKTARIDKIVVVDTVPDALLLGSDDTIHALREELRIFWNSNGA